jgi:anaerobic selenocysteine-containing dehydrogenase
MCHESSGNGLQDAIGIGKGTVTLDDFNHADCIVVVGQNPGTNHPRMLTALQKAARNGCQIIAINPLAEAGLEAFMNPQEVGGMLGLATPLAKLHLRVRINGDVAVFKGIMKEMLALDGAKPGTVLDRDFIEKNTVGFDAFRADLEKTSWAEIEKSSGLARQEI